jgi:hypothetical protein
MKKHVAFILLVCWACVAQATQQESDFILFKGQKCELETHWMFPSPLESYYRSDPSQKSPFESASTANYRGHVATWEIADGRLYLVDIKARGAPEPDSAPWKKDTLPEQGKTLLQKLFPKTMDGKGRIFANWFDGNLRVFGKPVKRIYKHPGSEESREIVDYTEVTLLQLKRGVVTRETSFPRDQYWAKFQTYLDYRKLKPEEITAISDHVRFLDLHSTRWEDIGSLELESPIRTEKDFQVFLTRYWSEPIKIPLTKFEIVKDATINFAETGWIIDTGLRRAEGSHLLMLEMGSINVPKGPWSAYTGGAVQLVIQLGSLKTKELAFTETDGGILKFINHFANFDDPKKHVTGTLKIDPSTKGEVLLSGSIRLTSESPPTSQEILLERQKFPVLSIEDYVKRYNRPGAGPNEVGEILKRIEESSRK